MTGRGMTRRAALLGAASTATLGAAGAATAQQGTEGGEVRPDWGGWLSDVDGGYRDLRGQDEVTVSVGADGNGGAFAFAPAGIWVDPGTTVRWQWTGNGGGHNVVAETGPADLDSGAPVAEAGEHYAHMFEQPGITKYVCVPHRSLGMLGAVAVGDDVPTVQVAPSGGGAEESRPLADAGGIEVLLLMYAVAGLGAVSVFAAGWGRGLLNWRREVAAGAAVEETAEAEAAEPVRELTHDAFDPTGTVALVALYFVIVVLMWVFMYFVEFLGGGPTVGV